MPLMSTLRKQEQAYFCEFETSLACIIGSWAVRVTQTVPKERKEGRERWRKEERK